MRSAFENGPAEHLAGSDLRSTRGFMLARLFGWTWMDPAAGIIGAVVIASCHLAAIAEGDQLICGSGAQAMVAERLSPVRDNRQRLAITS